MNNPESSIVTPSACCSCDSDYCLVNLAWTGGPAPGGWGAMPGTLGTVHCRLTATVEIRRFPLLD